MKKLTLIVFSFFLAAPLSVSAASGQSGADFLDVPAGGRAAALGTSYAALATDALAPAWNPAGLGLLPQKQVALQHLSYLDSVRHEFGSFALPVFERGGIAFSVRDFSSGKIQGMDMSGNAASDFSAHYAAYSLSYGHAVTSALSLGLTGSMISAKLDDVSASAYSFDAGALYRPNEKMSLALVAANLGSDLTFLKEADSLPTCVKLEGAFFPAKGLLLTGGATFRAEGPFGARAGVEYKPLRIFALRAGFKTDNRKELSGMAGLTAGAGFEIMGHEISYAWVPFGDLGDTHYVSVLFKLGGKGGARK